MRFSGTAADGVLVAGETLTRAVARPELMVMAISGDGDARVDEGRGGERM